MTAKRRLYMIADDFGIGPETTRGILDVARAGRLTGSVMLVNTPYTIDAIADWERAGRPIALGWHPNLTLDSPILPASVVPSLAQPDGRFWPLGKFLLRAMTGRLVRAEVEAELAAQHARFIELMGHPPRIVNSHQHVSIFPPVGRALVSILAAQPGPRPFLRRVGEKSWSMVRIPGARVKRSVLSFFGRWHARHAGANQLHGAEWLAGVTDPPVTADPHFYTRWLGHIRGDSVEVGCHPGYRDETLLGRDVPGKPFDLERRDYEREMILHDDFAKAVENAGFEIVPASAFLERPVSLAWAA